MQIGFVNLVNQEYAMFRRMREDEEGQPTQETAGSSNTPGTSASSSSTSRNTTSTASSSGSGSSPASASAGSTPAPAATPAQPARPAAGIIPGRPATPDPRSAAPAPYSRNQNFDASADRASEQLLIVGKGISLEGGKISNCDRLVVDGKVIATLSGVREIEINETGVFEGKANIENADINGVFDGELTVKNRLVINSSGQVKGRISYGEIEIARGGELSGEIVHDDETEGSKSGKKSEPVSA